MICNSGESQIDPPPALLATGAGGGIKGTQFAALMKNKPKMIKNRTTLILILVTTRLKRELKRMPVTRIAVKSKAINAAGRLKVKPNGPELPPVIVAGRFNPILCKISLKYFDQPIETADAPTRNSRIRSHPIIQAINSPSEAYEKV